MPSSICGYRWPNQWGGTDHGCILNPGHEGPCFCVDWHDTETDAPYRCERIQAPAHE